LRIILYDFDDEEGPIRFAPAVTVGFQFESGLRA
jgi:hypothetical protein